MMVFPGILSCQRPRLPSYIVGPPEDVMEEIMDARSALGLALAVILSASSGRTAAEDFGTYSLGGAARPPPALPHASVPPSRRGGPRAVPFGAPPRGAPAVALGGPAPGVGGGEFAGGPAVTGFERGTTYVVEFWKVGCPPCRAAIPH